MVRQMCGVQRCRMCLPVRSLGGSFVVLMVHGSCACTRIPSTPLSPPSNFWLRSRDRRRKRWTLGGKRQEGDMKSELPIPPEKWSCCSRVHGCREVRREKRGPTGEKKEAKNGVWREGFSLAQTKTMSLLVPTGGWCATAPCFVSRLLV